MRPRRMNKLDMFYNGFFMRAPKFKALLIYFERMKATLQGCWEQMLRKGEFGKALCLTHCRCRWAPLRGEGSFITPADEVISFFMHTREEAVFESPSGVKVLREAIQPAEIIKSEKPLLPLVVDFDGDITKADGALQVILNPESSLHAVRTMVESKAPRPHISSLSFVLFFAFVLLRWTLQTDTWGASRCTADTSRRKSLSLRFDLSCWL